MKNWKYYLLVLPFYVLLLPFTIICLIAELCIILMAMVRLISIISLYFIMGIFSIIEPRLINKNLSGSAKYKLGVALELIKEEVEDSKFYLKHYLLIFKKGYSE